MNSNNDFTLKPIINILKRETTNWKEFELNDGDRALSRDDIICELHWRKGKLYEIGARDFISFAKEDLEENSVRAKVNALSNAKRAVECRIDELLTLFNIRDFVLSPKSKLPPNLPNKLIWLQKLGIKAPDVLRRWITSPRNLLEHEYRVDELEKIRDGTQLAELFIEATDKHIDKGYIDSATVVCTKWYKPAVCAPTWFGKELAESSDTKFEYEDGYSDEYAVEFDFKNKSIIIIHSDKELYLQRNRKTKEEKQRKSHIVKKGDRVTSAFRDCNIEEIVELMTLLRGRVK